MTIRLGVFGLGDTACAWAESLAGRGAEVAGTVRTAEKQARLGARGWEVACFERGRALPEDALRGLTHVLVSIPPDSEAGDPVLDRALDRLREPTVQWVGYLSSTGVYGDHQGAWVDEETPLRPAGSERARRRARVEARWLALAGKLPLHVFRLAGLYGPGRNAVEAVRAGRARRLDAPGVVFSRIHRDDVLQVLDASLEQPRPGAIYDVADREPAPYHEVVAYACELLGVEPPPLERLEDVDASPALRSFYRDRKRVRAERIRSELGVELRYPTYREGLAALL
ncbi:MAG: SDR family oxidoreductase [Planctomycetota bacterium]